MCPLLLLLLTIFIGQLLKPTNHNIKLPEQSRTLLVGILSKRENFHHRLILRKWLGEATRSLDSKVIIKFIVSSDPCPIQELDRIDEYNCIENGLLQIPDDAVPLFSVPIHRELDTQKLNHATSYLPDTSSIGIDFAF